MVNGDNGDDGDDYDDYDDGGIRWKKNFGTEKSCYMMMMTMMMVMMIVRGTWQGSSVLSLLQTRCKGLRWPSEYYYYH